MIRARALSIVASRPFMASLFVALFTSAVTETLAHADPSSEMRGGDMRWADGKWTQGALHEEYTVQQWLPGCGPAPISSTQGGGDTVSIHQEGDELSIAGGGRVYKTNQCYDQLPTLARDAHSRDPSGRAWRTRCTTPQGDPRRAMMNTLVSATSDTHIDVSETGRYEISLAEGRCIADVKRSRGYDLVARDGASAPIATTPAPQPALTAVPAPAAVPAPPAPAPRAKACASPGDPARLEVRPSRKLLRAGESFTFHASVTDANGCATGTTTSWSVATGSTAAVTVDPAGKVTVGSDATEGSVEIVASAAGKSTRVKVDVALASDYDALLAKSGLNAAGENDDASVAEIATGSIGGGGAKVEDGASKRRLVFIVIVGLLASGLGILAVVFSRRAKKAAALEAAEEERFAAETREAEERKREKRAAHDAAVRAHEESIKNAQAAAKRDGAERDARASSTSALASSLAQGAPQGASHGVGGSGATPMICPTCRREYPSTSAYCPQDAAKLVPFNGGGTPMPPGAICPACKRGFDAGVKVCPFDREELIPYAMHAAAPKLGTGTMLIPPRGKICPTCGGRFDGNATFCGKDGTALVLIN